MNLRRDALLRRAIERRNPCHRRSREHFYLLNSLAGEAVTVEMKLTTLFIEHIQGRIHPLQAILFQPSRRFGG